MRMMILKQMAAVLCLFLFVSLAGCGFQAGNGRGGSGNNYENNNKNDTNRNASNDGGISRDISKLLPKKLIKVGAAQAGHESEWRIAATKSIQETFCEKNGYQLYFVDADNDPKAQISAVRNFIREQADYIIINPILADGWDAVLKEAHHAKIPVFLMYRMIDCDPVYYKAWFGCEGALEGEPVSPLAAVSIACAIQKLEAGTALTEKQYDLPKSGFAGGRVPQV